jgi:4-diphosphocytidyl-2C-methyl-D-erythritol kinase
VDIQRCGRNTEKTNNLLSAIRRSDAHGILSNIHNDFEEFILEKFPALQRQKILLEAQRGGRIILAGSGGALTRIYIRN